MAKSKQVFHSSRLVATRIRVSSRFTGDWASFPIVDLQCLGKVSRPRRNPPRKKRIYNQTNSIKWLPWEKVQLPVAGVTSPERCWVSVLAGLINDFQSCPMHFVNAGIGANVISTRSPAYEQSGKPAANERLEKHVLKHDPDLLIISYGLNDARGGTPLNLFRTELALVVHRVREKIQPLIVLLGPYYMTDFIRDSPLWNHANLELFKRFNEATAQIALQQKCLYVDLLAASGLSDWDGPLRRRPCE